MNNQYDIIPAVKIDANSLYIAGSDHDYQREIETLGYWTEEIPEVLDTDGVTVLQAYVAPTYVPTVYKQVVITEAIIDPATYDTEGNELTPETVITPAVMADFPLDVVPSRPPSGFHWPKWDGAQWVEGTTEAGRLPDVKSNKIQEITAAYNAAEATPVDAIGFQWPGTREMGLAYDAERRGAEEEGELVVEFHDINQVEHTLSFADAAQVVLAMRAKCKFNVKKYKTALRAIELASTIAEVEAIVW